MHMNPAYAFDPSEIDKGQPGYHHVEGSGKRSEKGCFLSAYSVVLLTILVVALGIGCGLLAHFVTKNQCVEIGETTTIEAYTPSTFIPVTTTSDKITTGTTISDLTTPNTITTGTTTPATPTPITTVIPGTTTSSTTTAPPTENPTDVRLPQHVVPEFYTLELQPFMYGDLKPEDFYFDGKVDIQIKCVEPTKEIVLHINKLTINDDKIKLQQMDTSAIIGHNEWVHDEARQFFKLPLKEILKVNETYVLHLEFKGILGDDMFGFYRSSYQKEDNATMWIATTQLAATAARKAFPCFDEPAIKAQFKVTLLRKSHMTSISNMPQTKSTERDGDWVADEYDITPTMSTYLLAFIVFDFESKEMNTSRGTLIRVWSRPAAINQADYSLEAGVNITEHFENFFDVAFPLPKQDMVAVPDLLAVGMENWGIITYKEAVMLYKEDVSTTADKELLAFVISHELAHQWFGNLVTPKWWDDIWLNEGFASFVGYKGLDHFEPSWGMKDLFVANDFQPVLSLDDLGSSHPVYVPVGHPDEILDTFDTITYSKGASIIRMMDDFLTESTFRKGLTNYLKEYSYRNSNHTDLWAALNEQAQVDNTTDIDVGEIMDTWILQMGYPVVTFNRSQSDPGSVMVTQSHFLRDPDQVPDPKYPSPFNYKWMVPLTGITDKGEEIKDWMKKDDISITVANDTKWIVGNIDQKNFYRVNYDLHNWLALIDQLETDHTKINLINRAQIIDDAFQLTRAGLTNEAIGMLLTKYLLNETEYIPWKSAIDNIGYIGNMISKTDYHDDFKAYMLKIIDARYTSLGWNTTGSSHQESYLRSLIIGTACSAGMQDCLDTASDKYTAWMNGTEVDPDLKSVVYCYGIRQGGSNEWEFALKKYKESNVATEKNLLLYAMSCTSESWILSKYLEMSLEMKDFRLEESYVIPIHVSRSSMGSDLVWYFFKGNWEKFRDSYKSGFYMLRYIVSGITSSFSTDREIRRLEEFKRDHVEDIGSAERALDQAIERAKVNNKWVEENSKFIIDWLININKI